jgi:hypothetical protein
MGETFIVDCQPYWGSPSEDSYENWYRVYYNDGYLTLRPASEVPREWRDYADVKTIG